MAFQWYAVTASVEAGKTYYVVVDAMDDSVPLNFTLTVSCL